MAVHLGRRATGVRLLQAGAIVSAVLIAGVFATRSTATSSRPAVRPAVAGCSAPGVTSTSVTVGLLYPNSGPLSSIFQPFRAGVDARLGVANAAGGVYGRKITYDWADDQAEPSVNKLAARGLIEQNKVFALLEQSTVATGSAAYLHQQGVPVLGTPLETVWSQYDNMFTYFTYLTRRPAVSTFGDYAQARGGTSAAMVISPLNDASAVGGEKIRQSLASANIPVVATIDASGQFPDYAALGAQVKAAGADTLAGVVEPETFLRIAVAAKAAGANLKLIAGITGYDQRVLDAVGKILPGFSVFLPDLPFETNRPAHRAFLTAMAVYAPQLQPARSQVALDGWIDTDMLLRGLRAAGPCPTRAGYIKALRAVRNFDAGGLLPRPVNFSTSVGKASPCFVVVRIAPTGDRWNVDRPIPFCGHTLNQK
ncbi:MAG: ABC transporter substrate-binding protein [Frankia sp.]